MTWPHPIKTALGFVRENAPESSTRLVMLLCTLGGLGSAYGTYRFAMANPVQTGTVAVLAGMVGAFIAAGAVAIAQRTRKGGEPGDSTPQGPTFVPPQP